jgi:WhiB family transcriptional regulator, redox-sensing transcriptional regulator
MPDQHAGRLPMYPRQAAGLSVHSRQTAGLPMRPQLAVAVELPCRSDPELFFAEKPEDVERARALCRACPVRAACLAGALQRGEPFGVWGGELLLRGAVIPYKRPRGRPRRSAAA